MRRDVAWDSGPASRRRRVRWRCALRCGKTLGGAARTRARPWRCRAQRVRQCASRTRLRCPKRGLRYCSRFRALGSAAPAFGAARRIHLPADVETAAHGAAASFAAPAALARRVTRPVSVCALTLPPLRLNSLGDFMNLAYTLSTMYKRVHPERRATSDEARRCEHSQASRHNCRLCAAVARRADRRARARMAPG